jgi:hypothetical protein
MMAGKAKELGGVKYWYSDLRLRRNRGKVIEKTLADIIKLFRVLPVLGIVHIGGVEVSIGGTFQVMFTLM